MRHSNTIATTLSLISAMWLPRASNNTHCLPRGAIVTQRRSVITPVDFGPADCARCARFPLYFGV
jgi:hypothetical protein